MADDTLQLSQVWKIRREFLSFRAQGPRNAFLNWVVAHTPKTLLIRGVLRIVDESSESDPALISSALTLLGEWSRK